MPTDAADALGSSAPHQLTSRRISVCGPAQAWFVPTIRVMAADLAGRADFTLDGIDDLRMAVDEACGCLLRLADQEQPSHCSFQASPAKIEVRARVSVRHPDSTLDTSGFGWRVLTCLTDEASTTREGDELQIRVTKTAR